MKTLLYAIIFLVAAYSLLEYSTERDVEAIRIAEECIESLNTKLPSSQQTELHKFKNTALRDMVKLIPRNKNTKIPARKGFYFCTKEADNIYIWSDTLEDALEKRKS